MNALRSALTAVLIALGIFALMACAGMQPEASAEGAGANLQFGPHGVVAYPDGSVRFTAIVYPSEGPYLTVDSADLKAEPPRPTGAQSSVASTAVVLVVDGSREMSAPGLVDLASDTALALSRRLRPHYDRVAVLEFADEAYQLHEFADFRNRLYHHGLKLSPEGPRCTWTGVAAGLEEATSSPLPARALVLITTGPQGEGETCSALSTDDMVQAAVATRTTVHVVHLMPGAGSDPVPLGLLAEATGGAYYALSSPEVVDEVAALLAERIGSGTRVTFRTALAPGSHTLSVAGQSASGPSAGQLQFAVEPHPWLADGDDGHMAAIADAPAVAPPAEPESAIPPAGEPAEPASSAAPPTGSSSPWGLSLAILATGVLAVYVGVRRLNGNRPTWARPGELLDRALRRAPVRQGAEGADPEAESGSPDRYLHVDAAPVDSLPVDGVLSPPPGTDELAPREPDDSYVESRESTEGDVSREVDVPPARPDIDAPADTVEWQRHEVEQTAREDREDRVAPERAARPAAERPGRPEPTAAPVPDIAALRAAYAAEAASGEAETVAARPRRSRASRRVGGLFTAARASLAAFWQRLFSRGAGEGTISKAETSPDRGQARDRRVDAALEASILKSSLSDEDIKPRGGRAAAAPDSVAARKAAGATAESAEATGDRTAPFSAPETAPLGAAEWSTSKPESDKRQRAPFALVGTISGKYRLEAPLGRGGLGEVYRARDLILDRPVALKLLLGTSFEGSAAVDQLQREAGLAAKLNHPNVVMVYDITSFDGHATIVMEYVAGQSLAETLVERGILEDAEMVPILDGVAAALDAAHAQNVVHGDVKPSNVILGEDGQVKLCDFGIARRIGDDPTAPWAGSPGYTAPEVESGADPDARSDVYSLGALVVTMLTGRPDAVDELPPSYASVLRTALQPQPNVRCTHAGLLATAFRAAVERNQLLRRGRWQRLRDAFWARIRGHSSSEKEATEATVAACADATMPMPHHDPDITRPLKRSEEAGPQSASSSGTA